MNVAPCRRTGGRRTRGARRPRRPRARRGPGGERGPVPAGRPQPQPRVAGLGGVDQLVERDLVGPGQGQQQLQGGPALPRLQPRQRARRAGGGPGRGVAGGSGVGRRGPDSSRDSVDTEMPVSSASWARVAPRCLRSSRSRGPTPSRTASRSVTRPVCHYCKEGCQDGTVGRTVVRMDGTYDVVVIGGGAAGLSGALALGRARRSVAVVDEGTPRNAPAHEMHNYLGRDGTPPAHPLAAGGRGGRRRGGGPAPE